MLSAPFGGSGGRPIEGGMVVEEPDIEIGAGVSSKAISRRMQTDKGGSNGPKSTRTRGDDDQSQPRWQRGRSDDNPNNIPPRPRDDRPGPPGVMGVSGPPGAMPSFPFGIGTLPNGMPNFPANFSFPDPTNGGR